MNERWMQPLEGRRLCAGTRTEPLYEVIHDDFTRPIYAVVTNGHKRYTTGPSSVLFLNDRAGAKGASFSFGSGGVLSVLGPDGTLTLTGSRKDDAFEVVGNTRRVEIAVRLKGSHTQELIGTFDARKIKAVRVEGGDGTDTLTVNPFTQALTIGNNVENRNLQDFSGAVLPAGPSDPALGVYGGRPAKWVKRSLDQVALPERTGAQVALLGDSMLARFGTTGTADYRRTFGRSVVNLGLPGDTTSQLLYRIQNQGLLDGMKAKVVVLNIGTNNASISTDADAIAAGIAKVVEAVRRRLPDARVLLTGILPQHRAEPDATIARVNAKLPTLADGEAVRFVPEGEAFSSDAANSAYYMPENIHLNPKGYRAWSSVLRRPVAAALG